MGTRSGDVDPGVVLKLCRELGIDETDTLLNRKSGLAGISGLGNDLRDIEAKAAEGDDRARLAIVVFAHQVRKYIGAYAAVMGGIDAVILTGGIGQNSVTMRQRILQRLEFLGLRVEEDLNRDARVDASARLSTSVHVVRGHGRSSSRPTKNSRLPRRPQNSSVTAWLCRRPSPSRLPSAAVNFTWNQIEISRTDEFKLGVDASIRGSGQVDGAAPIALAGTHGTVHLEEGLICAASTLT